MISAMTRWLARHQFPRLAEVILNSAANLSGNDCRIHYLPNGHWAHHQDGWIMAEAFPDFRFDVRKLRKFIETIYFYQYRPSAGDICIDVGAGIGSETVYMAKKIGDGKVYAIEASAHTFELLRTNIAQNQLSNALPFCLAISDSNAPVKISNVTDHHIVNTVFSNEGQYVDALTMDQFIEQQQISRINYLKVNIEGAEQLLIKKFSAISKVQHVAISCHDFLGKREKQDFFFTKDLVLDFLRKNDFEVRMQNTGTDYIDDWVYGINRNWKGQSS